jgi:hypothetical protein
MIELRRVAASILAVAALSAAGAEPVTARKTPFSQLGAREALQMRGAGGSATLDFGARSDELVTRAALRIRYSWSPALDPAASHIRVIVNGETVGALPLLSVTPATPAERVVDIDPRLLVGFNKATFTLVATKAEGGAADPERPGLWAEVSTSSELDLQLRPLVPADDLAILPEPFFDKHDSRRVIVPFVFAAKPTAATLRAAAVAASWLGNLARWRGARFPVSFDTPAAGHAIAFATNGARPAFLSTVPPAKGPELRLMNHPDGHSKLLAVLGRDEADLKAAVDALAIGGLAMSGPSVQVKKVEDKAPLAPYEAPAWVPMDRAARLGDFLEWAQQLEAAGRAPDLEPVRVELRVPPDLATWRGPGAPLALKVQYTPPACITDGTLDVSVNDELLQTLALRIANEPIIETKELFIPFYRLRPRSELKFAFHFAAKDEPQCRGAGAPILKASVLPESTLDVSGFPHYARLPNLAWFAALGYPFTRRADLSETVVVLPEPASAADIEAMLALMARAGEATGYPATRVRIASPKDAAALEGVDLLVIGASPQQALLDQWGERVPATLAGSVRRVSQSSARVDGVFDWLGMGAPADTSVAREVAFEGIGPVAALYGFESPVSSGRSVIAVTALAPDQLDHVIDALDDRLMRREVKGSAAFIVNGKVESVLVGPTYHVGRLPPWTGGGYWLSQHPAVLGTALTLILVAFGYLAYLLRNRFVAWRARRR